MRGKSMLTLAVKTQLARYVKIYSAVLAATILWRWKEQLSVHGPPGTATHYDIDYHVRPKTDFQLFYRNYNY